MISESTEDSISSQISNAQSKLLGVFVDDSDLDWDSDADGDNDIDPSAYSIF